MGLIIRVIGDSSFTYQVKRCSKQVNGAQEVRPDCGFDDPQLRDLPHHLPVIPINCLQLYRLKLLIVITINVQEVGFTELPTYVQAMPTN